MQMVLLVELSERGASLMDSSMGSSEFYYHSERRGFQIFNNINTNINRILILIKY